MTLIELAGPKGAALWVNPAQVTHVQAHDVGEGSMYGSSNAKSGARIYLVGGTNLDVRQSLAEVVAAFGG